MNDWTRADRWRTELAGAAGAVPIDLVAAFGIALLEELGRRGTPHGALSPEMISVRRDGSALRVRIDAWPTDPTQETLLATGPRSMAAHPGVHYRANEQFTTDAFDARADCFAVGVMLYELAAGQLPFGHGLTGSFQVFLKLKRGGFTPLQELRPDIPEALAATIVRALALRPEERFDGVAAMASALRTVVRLSAGASTVVGAKAEPPAPIATSGPMTIGPPVPARLAPDRSGVPLDPLRPLKTETLPVATQAAIAAHRASEAQPPPTADPPRAGHAPSSPPTAAPTSPPPPREVPLPVRAIVEAVTRPEPPAPTPTPSQPVPRAEPLVRAAPLATPPARPIVMVPPRTAPSATPPSRPMVVVPQPVVDRPNTPAEPGRPPRAAPRLGPQTDPFEAHPPSERTQVTAPPAMETSRRTMAAHQGIGPDPMAIKPPKTVPPPPPRPTKPLAEAGPPRVRIAPDVAPRVATPPAEPRSAATVVAPAPLQNALRARSVELVEPDLAALQRMMEPSSTTASASTPVPAPPRSESEATIADDDQPAPPTDDTARRAAGEVTPPTGNPNKPTPQPLRSRDVVIISAILLLLGVGAGLIIRLPARTMKQAVTAQCVPGPTVVCPPPEPVAMPEPIPPKPVACVPPKPSPKLTCFYDGLSDGTARYLRGDRRGALTAFQSAEQCMPHNPRLLKWIGRCHEELRDRDAARTFYEEYLRRRPKASDADFYHERVQALSRAPDGGTR